MKRVYSFLIVLFIFSGCSAAPVIPIVGLYYCEGNTSSYLWDFNGSTISTYSEASDYERLVDTFTYTVKNGKHWVYAQGNNIQITVKDDYLTVGTNGFKCVKMKF